MTDRKGICYGRPFLSDIKDGDFNDDGIIDLETVLNNADQIEMLDIIGDFPIGLVLSGVQVFNNVKIMKYILTMSKNGFHETCKSVKLATVGNGVSY